MYFRLASSLNIGKADPELLVLPSVGISGKRHHACQPSFLFPYLSIVFVFFFFMGVGIYFAFLRGRISHSVAQASLKVYPPALTSRVLVLTGSWD